MDSERLYHIQQCDEAAGKLIDELQLLEDVTGPRVERHEIEVVKEWIFSARDHLKRMAER